MKILHVITSLHSGGAEKLLLDIIPKLKSKGHEVDLLLFDGSNTPFKYQAKKEGINIIQLSIGGNVYNPVNIIKLLRFLPEYDVVHTHNTAPQLFAAIGSVLCSCVLCTTEHSTSNRRRQWKWYTVIDRWMYGRYKKIISISPQTEEHLRISLNAPDSDKFITIYNGIDVKRYKEAKPVDIDKDGLGCRIALMQVAGFRLEKDQDSVIRSLKYLPEDIHLFLVGDGVRRSELEKITSDEGLTDRVHFLGIRSDVPGLLKSADIVVMSSHWEGFGLAAVEGMAAGKPVIASDVDGLREVVKGAGVLFAQGDSKGLADEIIKLDASPMLSNEIAKRCSSRASEYDISKMVEGYCKVYEEIKSSSTKDA